MFTTASLYSLAKAKVLASTSDWMAIPYLGLPTTIRRDLMHLTQGVSFHLDRIVTWPGGHLMPGLFTAHSEGSSEHYYAGRLSFSHGTFTVDCWHPEGRVQYRFVLGQPEPWECDENGTELRNRKGSIDGDTLIQHSREGCTRKIVIVRISTDSHDRETIVGMTVEIDLRIQLPDVASFTWSSVKMYYCRHGPYREDDYPSLHHRKLHFAPIAAIAEALSDEEDLDSSEAYDASETDSHSITDEDDDDDDDDVDDAYDADDDEL